MDTFGVWLTAQMNERRLRWADLAETVGLTTSAVTAWGRDETSPRRRNIPAIARFLHATQQEVHHALGAPSPYKRGDDPELDAALAAFEVLSPEGRAAALAMMRGLLADHERTGVRIPVMRVKE
jgi:hypothetical protein